MKNRYRIAAACLGVLLLVLLLVTGFGAHGLRGDTVAVALGFAKSDSPRAAALDAALLEALERGHFGEELRTRLDRPAYGVSLPAFYADVCEVKQLDFERFAGWHRRQFGGDGNADSAAGDGSGNTGNINGNAGTAAGDGNGNNGNTDSAAGNAGNNDGNTAGNLAGDDTDGNAGTAAADGNGNTGNTDGNPETETKTAGNGNRNLDTGGNGNDGNLTGNTGNIAGNAGTAAADGNGNTGNTDSVAGDGNGNTGNTDSAAADDDGNTGNTDGNTGTAAAEGTGNTGNNPNQSTPYSTSTGHRIAGLLASPASGVDYAAAAAYCQAAGGRLPWAEEWEAMAVGRGGRLYPWGDAFDAAAWPYQDAHRNAAQSCGLHDAATPEGVHDLANNVMEWSNGRAVGGGAFQPGAHGAPAVRASGRALYALSAAWLPVPPQTRSHHLGFRCIYGKPPAKPLPWGATPAQAKIPAGDYTLGMPRDLRLARIAVILPAERRREARNLLASKQARRLEVGRCEVSRREYRAFLRNPLVRLGLFANEHEPRGRDYTPRNWQAQSAALDLPVSGVDWWSADAFARWAGGRLPRVEEWHLIAAGADANRYPWGDDYQPGNAVTGDATADESGAQPCGTRDQTETGVADLAGNVSEWTLSVTAERGDYAAWVQGGNWRLPGNPTTQTTFGRPVPLNHQSETIGFRVVYD